MIPGAFTDCVNFRHRSNSSEVGTFQGQHCMVNFSPKNESAEIGDQDDFDWREM